MAKGLKEFQKELLEYDLTDQQILEIKQEVDRCWQNASEKERQEFRSSGAGDALEMALEYMD